ncbi:hypothetical protein NE237_024472 [Protea cynaroides]|uniref:Uncharacterized protein n=1 Tax=Protea cynaroides TaxID=273540 RepID=A0A9Q0GLH7_9MAGN|nr:hypothetical protein NE237_024472 [Protea cynaroides]
MRIGSNYAIRGGQAASRIAELEARVQELSSQVERSAQTAKQLEDMTARAAQLQEELATVTATSAERERALQAEVAELRRDLDTIIRERDTSNRSYQRARDPVEESSRYEAEAAALWSPGFPLVEPSEQHPAGDHWTFISGLQDLLSSTIKKYPVEGAGTRGSPLEGGDRWYGWCLYRGKVGRKAERRLVRSDSHRLAKAKNGTTLLTDTDFRNGSSFLTGRERRLLTELALVIDPIQAQDSLQVLVALLEFGKLSCSSRFFVLFLWNQLAISFCGAVRILLDLHLRT